MKNTSGTAVVFIAASALFVYLWAKRKAITALQFYVSDVSADFSNGRPIIKLDIAIQNPSNERFTINSIIGNLTVNGQIIGNVSSYAVVDVLPVHASVYPVSIQISNLGLGMTAYNLITNGIGTSQNIGFSGAINASGIVAPVDLNVKIG